MKIPLYDVPLSRDPPSLLTRHIATLRSLRHLPPSTASQLSILSRTGVCFFPRPSRSSSGNPPRASSSPSPKRERSLSGSSWLASPRPTAGQKNRCHISQREWRSRRPALMLRCCPCVGSKAFICAGSTISGSGSPFFFAPSPPTFVRSFVQR